MHPRSEEFVAQAREDFGFEPDIHHFPEGTKTAEEAAAAVGCELAQIASSIVISVDDELAVVVTSGAHRVAMDRVAEELDADTANMADPDVVKEILGWGIGGVPPFCHANDVPVLVDETLLEYDEVWAAGGTPDAVFPIDPAHILKYSEGKPARIHQTNSAP